MLRCTILVAAFALLVGCSKESESPESDELARQWESAGLKVADPVPLDDDKLGGRCQRRDVNGVTAMTCDFASAEAASAARAKGLALVGTHTGTALVSGSRLLVVMDRDGVDREGRTINTLTKAFVGGDTPAAAKPAEEPGGIGAILGTMKGKGPDSQGDE